MVRTFSHSGMTTAQLSEKWIIDSLSSTAVRESRFKLHWKCQVLTHWDTWVTGMSEISLSASISISSAMLLHLWRGGRDCTSKNPADLFTKDTQIHTFPLLQDLTQDFLQSSSFNKAITFYLPEGGEYWKEDREFQDCSRSVRRQTIAQW